MTHAPESEIEPAVADWFQETYGTDAVETQRYLPGVRWYCDIVVDVGFATLFVEVESRADAVRAGLAQAAGYAATRRDGIPLLVTPPDHVDAHRRLAFETGLHVPIREFDSEKGDFITDRE